MITLHQPRQRFKLINISPFCSKLETALRIAGVQYDIEPTTMTNFSKAPHGKVPWATINGIAVPDSSMIIDYLKKHKGVDLTEGYSELDHARTIAAKRILEEHTYWGIGYFRWMEDKQWPKTVVSTFAPFMPAKNTLAAIMKQQFLRQLKAQGLARHNANTILQLCDDDLKAISVELGNKEYYCTDKASLADATVFGFLDAIYHCKTNSRLKQAAQKYQNLKDYTERMGKQYFPEIYN